MTTEKHDPWALLREAYDILQDEGRSGEGDKMTKEQLDAIRARVDNARYRHWLGDKEALLNNAMNDLLDLLAEVERLTAERDTAFKRGVSVMREAAVLASRENIGCRHMVCHSCESPAAVIRALPDPEGKS